MPSTRWPGSWWIVRWRTPLAEVEETRFGATHKTRWGEDMSCEGMLEHAYSPAEAELASHVRRWNGSGFVDVERAQSFTSPRTEPTPFFGPLAERPPGG